MRATQLIMGMPVTVEIIDGNGEDLERVYAYFRGVDERFSTYKTTSEISKINRGELAPERYSSDMNEIFELADRTKQATGGYFDIKTPEGTIDPSGIVKGWAIRNAANLLRSHGRDNYYVEAGGDIQTAGTNADGGEWSIGIRNPFEHSQIVKVVYPHGKGIATSGTAARGAHIYDPHTGNAVETGVASITVIGPDVYEADRFATAAYAMGERGIHFIEQLGGFEAYAIDTNGTATMTSGFDTYTYA